MNNHVKGFKDNSYPYALKWVKFVTYGPFKCGAQT